MWDQMKVTLSISTTGTQQKQFGEKSPKGDTSSKIWRKWPVV
jgi:hypothetical protein